MNGFFKNKTVFITGGTGFIGSHLCRRLVLEGAQVHVLVRSKDNFWRLTDAVASLSLHEAPLADRFLLKSLITRIRPVLVFHLAADIELDRNPDLIFRMMKSNVESTWNLMLACEGIIERFIYTGTCEEYGLNQAPFEESMRERPVSPYSLSKTMASHLCLTLYETNRFPVTVVRPFLTYGPYQDNGMLIPSLVRACLEGRNFSMTSGEQTRDFIYVEDLVDGLLKTACADHVLGEIINLGSGQETPIRDVAKRIVELAGSCTELLFGRLPYRPGEVMHFFSNISKARRLIAWEPKTSLTSGLSKTIQWFQVYFEERKGRSAHE